VSPSPAGPVEGAAIAGALFRRAWGPTTAAMVLCAVGGWVTAGTDGLVGALVGAGLVVAFFGPDLLLMRMTARLDPVATFGLVMAEYLVKIALLAIFLAAFRGTTAFDTTVMAVTLAVGGVVWLTSVSIAFTRLRMYTTEPEGWAQPPSAGSEGDRPTT
jgi:ATP synthase protein I